MDKQIWIEKSVEAFDSSSVNTSINNQRRPVQLIMSVHDVSESPFELQKIGLVVRVPQIGDGQPENGQLSAQMQHEEREERVEARITDGGEQGAYKLSQPSKLEIWTLFGVIRKRGRMQEALQISFRRVLHVVENLEHHECENHDPRQRRAGDGYHSTCPGGL